MRRIAFSTLGCRLNQYETDALVTTCKRAGYMVVDWHEPADAYVINSCTVTDRSDRKTRQLIYQAGRAAGRQAGRQAGRDKDGRPIVVLTGCYADAQKKDPPQHHAITYVVDNDRKSQMFAIIDAHFRGEIVDPEGLAADRFSFGDSRDGFHTRGSIKIQDGCDNFCTFCVIPHVRGRAASRPSLEVLNQTREMIDLGAREIILTGVNIGRYNFDGVTFSSLLEGMLGIPGDFRIRVSSIEPDAWEKGFLPLLEHPKLCPHLHLCLQSGSDRILLAMRRRYSVETYLGFVESVRKLRPDFNFTTDIMVGFPGETQQDFENTCTVARQAGFSHIHTFPYSTREGTRAARSTDQIEQNIKADRARIIRDISNVAKRAYRARLVGQEQLVLVERMVENTVSGYGQHYVPITLPRFPGAEIGEFVRVRIESLTSDEEPRLIGATSKPLAHR